MRKYILIGLIFAFAFSISDVQAQSLPSKKRNAIEKSMFNMEYAQALQDIEREIKNYPTDYDLNLFRAICYSAIPRYNEKAPAAYDYAIKNAKNGCQANEAKYYLAKYYCEMGEKDKSLKVAKSIMGSDGFLDDCSAEMIQKLSKSSCMRKCDDSKSKNQMAELQKEAEEKEAADKEEIARLNDKIAELEKTLEDSKKTGISASERYKIYFAFNKSELTAESQDILDRYVDFLKANPDCKAKLVGHADMIGTKAANDKISRARALQAKDYLLNKGIPEERILVSYKSNDVPEVTDSETMKIYSDFTEGTELTPTFIKKLAKDKQTKANYLNRRVELTTTR